MNNKRIYEILYKVGFFVTVLDGIVYLSKDILGYSKLIRENLPTFIIVITVTIIFTLLFFLIHRRAPQIEFPNIEFKTADMDHISKIVKLDKKAFPKRDRVDKIIFTNWQRKNNNIFTVMLLNEKVIGYFAILPLKKEALDCFIKGYLLEKNIMPKDICTKDEMNKCESMYFYSILNKKKRSKSTYTLLLRAVKYIDDIRLKGFLKKVYATSVTEAGEKLIIRFGFKKIQDAKERAGKSSLYVKQLTENELLKDYFKFMDKV